MSKTLSYQHQARKKQRSEKDLKEKFIIINLLRKHFNLFGLTGETIPIPGKIYHRMPDVIIPHKNIAIELDGEIHEGWDQITKHEGDKDRDKDYKDAGYHLILVNKKLTNNYNEDLIIKELKKGLEKC